MEKNVIKISIFVNEIVYAGYGIITGREIFKGIMTFKMRGMREVVVNESRYVNIRCYKNIIN